MPLIIYLCSAIISWAPLNCEQIPAAGPTTSLYDFYLEKYSSFAAPFAAYEDTENVHRATPPLGSAPAPRRHSGADTFGVNIGGISPAKVRHRRLPIDSVENNLPETDDLFTPLFRLQSAVNPQPAFMMARRHAESLDLYQNDAQATSGDASVYSDLIDSGSGNFFENPPEMDGGSGALEESFGREHTDQEKNSVIVPTPVRGAPAATPVSGLALDATTTDENNQAPMLNRRLPRLAVTAGQVWKYFIPSDTFIDEDGDLRKLRSTIVRRNEQQQQGSSVNASKLNQQQLSTNQSVEFHAQYYSWVQYDASVQLLYGLPTENDIGKHELALIVGDRFGAASDEMIEIHVRPHQSSRAFTHQFSINNIHWDPEKFPSMVDALGELIKQISNRVFMDRAFENFIAHYYSVDDVDRVSNSSSSSGSNNRSRTSFTLAWSNNSIPIHPCNTSQIEALFRSMINVQFLPPNWSSDASTTSPAVPPSTSMLRILEPDFRPESVSVKLMGSCDSRELFKNGSLLPEHDNSDSVPRVRVKIGRLSWKLGQPIEYRIPVETFNSDRGAYTTRDLQLSLHTIDGLTLDKDPKYNFIDFDQENQVIFALPFDQEDHVGQRELQLTARHPKSGFKVREVFVVSIEPQDLTTINNRAFQMSLYFRLRAPDFGPQERISLSRKIIAATEGEQQANRYQQHQFQQQQQITVTSIAKYMNRGQLVDGSASMGAGSTDGEFVDITRYTAQRNADMMSSLLSNQINGTTADVYKFTWTNETIGSWGDCPVEVIKETILYSLEQAMLDFKAPTSAAMPNDSPAKKSDSARFFERLRQYFDPELDLIHLRFEPLGACMQAMELHDAGNSDTADMIDSARELDGDLAAFNQDSPLHPASTSTMHHNQQSTSAKTQNNNADDELSEEYWSIVVLLVLVVSLIFVIIMFFMGMHTYKINQDKRFEMQVKLAQARQNSMYLSSMILANLAAPNDCGSATMPNQGASMNRGNNICLVRDEEKGSRKPVILDSEKQLFNGAGGLRSMAVQLDGSSIRTTPVKQNSMVTLDSMASIGWHQPSVMGLSMSPSALLYTPMDNNNIKQRTTMTLNRQRAQRQPIINQPALNHSQSILTVASLGSATHHPLQVIPSGNIPMLYAAPVLPVISEPSTNYNYASLQRVGQPMIMAAPPNGAHLIGTNQLSYEPQQQHSNSQILPVTQQQQANLLGVMENASQEATNSSRTKKSSSRSSSVSAATNSIVSNPNYSPHV